MYEYKVKITRVIDGDTVDADVDLGFDTYIKDRIRLMGIDTPESRTRNKKEKQLGLASKARLKELCAINKGNIVLKTSKEGKGKFGRILGSLYVSGSNVSFNAVLVSEGHARPYFGGSKSESGEWTKETGCNCGGRTKTRFICQGTWERWTKNGYVPMESE
jgi:micrococcal nuclease